MLLRRYQQLVSKIAILLVLFATLAPSISHAVTVQHAQNKGASFLQEICSVDGVKKIVIQTVTTHGQQLETVFDAKSSSHNSNATHHLEHCPFCGSMAANITYAPPSPTWLMLLAQKSKASFYQDVVLPQPAYLQTAQASRAPPVL